MPQLPNFTFSPTALAQLRRVRQPISTGGKQTGGGAPIVGYWRKSEFTDAAWSEVSKVDGMDLIFSVRPIDRPQFEGKVIDYSPERTFFLRGAATGPAKR